MAKNAIEKIVAFVIMKLTGAPTPLFEVSNGSTFLFRSALTILAETGLFLFLNLLVFPELIINT